MAEYVREDRTLIVGTIITILVAVLFYAIWAMSEGQMPPEDLPECPAHQTLNIEDPSNPECR